MSIKKESYQSKLDIIRAHHTFLLEKTNNPNTSTESRILSEYHDKLFKEYCIGDLTNYKTNQVALRWRTKKEVISGKGETICGERNCCSKEDLKSWEVNFKYIENGQQMNTLVKLRLCKDCSIKLNYRHLKKKNNHSHDKSESILNRKIKEEPAEESKEENEDSSAVPSSPWDLQSKTDQGLIGKMEAYFLDFF